MVLVLPRVRDGATRTCNFLSSSFLCAAAATAAKDVGLLAVAEMDGCADADAVTDSESEDDAVGSVTVEEVSSVRLNTFGPDF